MLSRLARETDLCVGNPVLPGDVMDSPKAAQVEGVEFPFLLGSGGPSFAAVQQRIEDASTIHCYLCLRRELEVLPDACSEAGKRSCGLPNTFVELHVHPETGCP